MAKTLVQVQKEIESLQRQAEALRKAEVAGVISRIKDAIRAYELTAKDLGFGGKSYPTTPKTIQRAQRPQGRAKYRDPASGRTWSGHGRRPQWFVEALAAGKSAQDLAA